MLRYADYLVRGLGPVAMNPPNSGALVAFPTEGYQSPLLDLTKISLGVELIPTKPGHFAVLMQQRWLIVSVSGTQTSPPTSQAGSDPAHSNFLPPASLAPSTSAVNGANPPSISGGNNSSTPMVQKISNAPVILDITAGAQGTGGFSLFAKLVIHLFWFPVG